MSSSRPLLSVEGLSAAWDRTPVLRSISLDLNEREFLVLLGPNGSGKTTLLRCLAGLERTSAGRIRLDGADVTDLPAYRRGFGLMSQEPALFPHRTVYENIAYAPLLKRRPRSEVEEDVGHLIELVHLGGLEDRYPQTISGGERQRVALARALAARPKVVLLDEPFAAIDVEVKAGLHAEFREVLRLAGTAAIHVTHDREEGLFLGDRVGLLFDGALEAIDRPLEIYQHPRSVRAATFLGYNILEGPSGPVALGPGDLTFGPPGTTGLPATVVSAGTTGRETLLVLRTDDGRRVEVRLPLGGQWPPGTRGVLGWDPATVRPLPREPAPTGATSPKSSGRLENP